MNLLNNIKLKRVFHLFYKIGRRHVSTNLAIERLNKRTLLSISGKDTKDYLQSMMTNDMKNLDSLSTLYSLLLNPKGRVLYDIILYKLQENEYVVEYDATAVEHLEKHLLMYRLRKEVKIKPLFDLSAWVIYNKDGICDKPTEDISKISKIDGVISCVEDPRLKDLGVRVITNKNVDLPSVLPIKCDVSDSYRLLRYKLGVGEGVQDHPPGECDPCDINVDLLNGVSFTKGCYIGQEMTARSHHVFVIRKRLMPVKLQAMDSYPVFPPECSVENESGKKLGRFRCHLGQYGLGLLKYEDCEKSKMIKLKGFDVSLEVKRPHWWPSDLRTENL